MGGFIERIAPLADLSTMMPWAAVVPALLVRFIRLSERVGAIRIPAPALTRIKPMLTSLAAVGRSKRTACRPLTMKHCGLLMVLLSIPLLSYGQEKETYTIGILVDTIAPELAPLLDLLQNEIIAVVGEDATISFPEGSLLVNGFDVAQAEIHYQTLLDDDTDIIIAFGPVNNEIISGQAVHQKPTILFGALNRDLIDIDEDKETSGIDNFTYLITSQSYEQDLRTFETLYDFNHVGVIVAGPQLITRRIQEALDPVFAELGATYDLIPYTSVRSLDPFLDQIDAVYLAEGFSIPFTELDEMAALLIANGLPSFTATRREDVERGWMATNQADENLEQFFRRIALTVEAVVNGDNLSTLPLFIEYSETLTLNYNTAERVDVPLKYSLIATTDLVGDFDKLLAERTYSLLDVIQEVIAANLSLETSRKDIELAQQDVKTAKSTYLPNVSASATGSYLDPEVARASNGQNPEYSTDGNVTLTQTLFSEAANANISIQKSLLKAQQENFNAEELDLILDASNAYFNVLILKANVQIQQQNLDVTKRNLKIAEQNFEAGQSGQADVLRFRSELAQNMQTLIEAINQLNQGFHVLNLLLNNPIDLRINVEDAVMTEGVFEDYDYEQLGALLDDSSQREVFVDFLVEEALKNAPELKVLDYNLEATERNIVLNGYRRFMPTVAAQAQYNRNFDQWGAGALPSDLILQDNYSVGLNFSIPIFDQNRETINRQTALVQRSQLELNRANTALALERNVRDAVFDLTNQIANIELSRVSEETAAQGLELTEASYSNGAVNVVQLIDAQRNLLQAQLARANATYNYLLSTIILERYLGYYFLLHSEAENQAFIQRFLTYQSSHGAQR